MEFEEFLRWIEITHLSALQVIASAVAWPHTVEVSLFHEYHEFYFELERRIAAVVPSKFSRSWDENHITYCILESLKGMGSKIEIAATEQQQPIHIHWDFMKLKGSVETAYGDIAVVVRLFQSDGIIIEGVGAIEAKRISNDRAIFPALNAQGLNRLRTHLRNLPRTNVVLYDHEPIAGFIRNIPQFDHWRPFHNLPFPDRTFAAVVPSDLLLASGKTNTLLYPLSVPLSFQIAWRYLRGFDLHFGTKALDRIKDYSPAVGGIQFMILASVIKGEDRENSLAVDNSFFGEYESID